MLEIKCCDETSYSTQATLILACDERNFAVMNTIHNDPSGMVKSVKEIPDEVHYSNGAGLGVRSIPVKNVFPIKN